MMEPPGAGRWHALTPIALLRRITCEFYVIPVASAHSGGGAGTWLHHTHAHPTAGHTPGAAGPRRVGVGTNRHRQNRRLRAADRAASHAALPGASTRLYPRPDARTRGAN